MPRFPTAVYFFEKPLFWDELNGFPAAVGKTTLRRTPFFFVPKNEDRLGNYQGRGRADQGLQVVEQVKLLGSRPIDQGIRRVTRLPAKL